MKNLGTDLPYSIHYIFLSNAENNVNPIKTNKNNVNVITLTNVISLH